MTRALTIAAAVWTLCVGLPSIPSVRAALVSPLVVSDSDARGDACYVLASGDAWTERLAAASDLYHMHRVARVILQRDPARSSYNFVARSSWTRTDWALDFLAHRGVPLDAVTVIPEASGVFGTLAEARNVRANLPGAVRRLVLVSSAPHMRRSLLAFRRVLAPDVELDPYAASGTIESAELYRPIWLEYLKLAGYALAARR